MLSFQATLYDRHQQQQYPANVRSEPGFLSISYQTAQGTQHVDWILGDIESAKSFPDGQVILQRGKHYLEVNDPGFRAALDYSFPKHRLFHQTFFDRIGTLGCLLALLVVLLPIIGAFFWLAPFLADKAAEKISPETERQIGDVWFKSLTSTYQIDSAETRLVQSFYDSLHYGGEYQMRITVVKEPVINAFAVPGGQIVVFDSILHMMDAPEQLAALLGHEASHVQLKHSTRSILRSLSNQLFFTLLVNDYADLSVVIGQQTQELLNLSYSRSLESEADDNGLKLMEKSNIPLTGMYQLFQKMDASTENAGGPEMPTFMSTHPSLKERMQEVETKIKERNQQDARVSPGVMAIWKEIKR